MIFKPVHDPTHLYFITATILGWVKLFETSPYAKIILDSLDWHRSHGRWQLYAYVVMPNHIHAIIKPCAYYTVSGVLQSFGSFTAHAILERLRETPQTALLTHFAQRQDRDERKAHQIWQPLQAKNVWSEAFLRQKLEYIHNNPVAKGWELVDNRADYEYSSACFYDCGHMPVVAVDDVRECFG